MSAGPTQPPGGALRWSDVAPMPSVYTAGFVPDLAAQGSPSKPAPVEGARSVTPMGGPTVSDLPGDLRDLGRAGM